MKRTTLVVALAVMLLLSAGVSVNSACAFGCPDWEVSCCIDGDKSQTLAKTSFTMCWSLKRVGCVPCHGGGKWSWFADWCNNNYNECQARCQGCIEDETPYWTPLASSIKGKFSCVDSNGHWHSP